MMVFSGFLHQHLQGEKLVSTASAMTETILAFPEELLCFGLEAVQDGFGEHFSYRVYSEERYHGSCRSWYRLQRHKKLTLLVLRD